MKFLQEKKGMRQWLLYCKSVAERLEKMSAKQQAYATLKIEEALYLAEFGPHILPETISSHPDQAFSVT